ncbi:MAG: AAA family ATPase, partial [Pseudomonadota bacterium]
MNHVVLLNGSTSAGKTSIAREVQRQSPALFLNASIDAFINMLPIRLRSHPDGIAIEARENGGIHLVFGPAAFAMQQAFHRAVAAMADVANVIVDDCLFDPRLLPDWQHALEKRHVFLVGVHCSLAELERREQERGDRMIGQARA